MVVSVFKYICSTPPTSSHSLPNKAPRPHAVWLPPWPVHSCPATFTPHSLVVLLLPPPPTPIRAPPFSTSLGAQYTGQWAPSVAPDVLAPVGGQSAKGGRVQVEIRGLSPGGRGWFPPHYSPARRSSSTPLPGLDLHDGPCWLLNPPTPLSLALSLYPPQLSHWNPDSSNHLIMTDLGVSCVLFPQPPPDSFLWTPAPYKTSLSVSFLQSTNYFLT